MNKKAISIEALFVMLLFIIFTVSMIIMILSGRTGYENILNEKKEAEEMRISASYIRMKIKQNDISSRIFVRDIPHSNIECLEIKHDEGYRTVILYRDGKVWEAYLSEADSISTMQAEPIIDLSFDDIKFVKSEHGIEIIYKKGTEQMKQFVAIKSEE